jgi:hypothetical protein
MSISKHRPPIPPRRAYTTDMLNEDMESESLESLACSPPSLGVAASEKDINTKSNKRSNEGREVEVLYCHKKRGKEEISMIKITI